MAPLARLLLFEAAKRSKHRPHKFVKVRKPVCVQMKDLAPSYHTVEPYVGLAVNASGAVSVGLMAS